MKIGTNVPWFSGKSPFEFFDFWHMFYLFLFAFPAASATEMWCGIDWLENCPATEPVCLYTSEVETSDLTGLHTDSL